MMGVDELKKTLLMTSGGGAGFAVQLSLSNTVVLVVEVWGVVARHGQTDLAFLKSPSAFYQHAFLFL